MISTGQYELLDFGNAEKLESFGGTVVRRETPSAIGLRGQMDQWERFDLRGNVKLDGFQWAGKTPDPWWFCTDQFRIELRTTPTGQVGVFPEQAVNWRWIADAPFDMKGMRAINLFAYTGASTMALAQRGANVVHVDAAKSVVNWARSNARESGLSKAPIRWIIEDAMTFVQREIKRGNKYDIVVADPPSFGRGPKGEWWKIQRDLNNLIQAFAQLTQESCQMLLISCHTQGINHDWLANSVSSAFRLGSGKAEAFELSIESSLGKQLPSGSCFRWMNSTMPSRLES